MRIPLTSDERLAHLEEQLSMLEDSCKLYDQGKWYEAKRIATIIGTLLYDGKKSNSVSLITQMGLDIKMLDTAGEPSPCMINNFFGLVAQRLSIKDGKGSAMYEALLDNLPPSRQGKSVSRSEWLSKVVLIDGQEEFSRERLMLGVRDTDGGAHVDPTIPQETKSISRKELSQTVPIINNVQHEYENRPDLASIRQMGYEVLTSLRPKVG